MRLRLADRGSRLLRSARWALALAWSTDRWSVAGVLVIMVVMGAVPAGLAVAIRGLINAVEAIVRGETSDSAAVWFWLGAGALLTLVSVLSRYIDGLLDRRLQDRIVLRVNTQILEHAARLDISFFETPKHHDMLQRARSGAPHSIHRFLRDVMSAATNAVTTISLFAVLAVIEPLIAPVMVITAAPYIVFQVRQARRAYLIEHSRAAKRRWTNYFSGRLTTMPSAAEVRMLDLAPLLLARFRSLMQEFLVQDWKLHLKGFRAGVTFGMAATVAIYALFVRVVFRALEGAVTLGDVAIFGGATSGLRNSVEQAAFALRASMSDSLFVSDIIAFLEHRARISSLEGSRWPGHRGELCFEEVRFTYPGSTRAALRGVSLRIEAGETLAIVGENGAGKSTLVKLAARLYDPDEGRILADGTDLRDLAPADYHRKLAFVFQQFGRYEATAAENIAYGDWRRLLDDRGAIEEIVRRMGLSHLVGEMPDGLDTALGRNFGDYDPSAGQWQIIAVARALARDAAILILDEPTASLDARAEYDLFVRFRELAQGRTTLLISHRFSTVAMADRVAVMAEGRIAEIGTHEELLDQGGVYATLYSLHRRDGFSPITGAAQRADTAGTGPPRS